MAIDYDSFCAVCGAPFSHVELLDFSLVGEEEEYLKNTLYNSQLLSPDQCAVSRLAFFLFPSDYTPYTIGSQGTYST